jgi:nucleoside-diphosphate-sugar epimerase
MTTLVTGATGFTGINIVRGLAEAGETVVAMGHRPASAQCHRFLRGLEDSVRLLTGDVLDCSAMLRLAEEHDVQRIVHAAAVTPSGGLESANPRLLIDVNLVGTVNMLEVARQISASRLVFVSSSGVYGAPEDRTRLVPEDSPLQLNSLYTICKRSCELLLRRYRHLFGLSTVTGRMTSIYGPMERATPSRGRPSTVYKVVDALLAGRAVKARGGEFVRDYTHVEDAARIWTHLTLAEELDHDLYNVSAGVAYSLEQVLGTLQGLDASFSYSYVGPDDHADVEVTPPAERGALDITRISAEFGFVPQYNLQRGLQSYLAWAGGYPGLFSSGQSAVKKSTGHPLSR